MRIARSVCWLALLASVFAYRLDSAMAQGSDAERQACTPDAMRLCNEFIPDVAKVTACMKAKHAELSEPCRLAMAGGAKPERPERHERHERHEARHHRQARAHCDPFTHLCS